MADQNINVDINVNSESLKQISQLKGAIDGLRDTISNLNKEILKYNSQAKETITWGTKIKTTIKDLWETFETGKKILDEAGIAFGGWSKYLLMAFSFITTYGPQILDFLSDMFQSEKTKQAAEALRDYKEVMETYLSNMSDELSQVGMLVNIATDRNEAQQVQIEAIQKLNSLSPEYLKNLTLENIKTKEGKELIDEYIKSLNRKAMEEAVQAKRTEYVKQRLDLKAKYDMAKAEKEDYRTGRKKNEPYAQQGYSINDSMVSSSEGTIDSKKFAYDNFANVAKQDEELLSKIKNLDDQLATSLIKYAPKPSGYKVHNKAYWQDELAAQQSALDKLDAGTKDFENKSKPIVKRIREINKLLSNYSVHDIKKTKKTVIHPTQAELNDAEKAFRESLMRQSQATAQMLAKKAELEHNNYITEQAALKNLYDNKLITQEQYQDESEKLEEKYHVNIGNMVKRMNEDDLDKMQKQQKDLIDTQTQNKLINADQHDVDKALPWNKLDAEKKLITDKYNFEIQKAAEAGKDTAEIRKQYEQEITDVTKQFEQQRKDFAIQTAQQVSSAAFSIIGNSIKSQTDAKIKGLENDKANELSNKNLTSTQKQAIEQKYKQKENQAKLKAFKDEQKLSLAQALINGALAITKVTSQTGVLAPFVIPGIIAETAIQVAAILKQKPPAFAKGGRFISDGRGALLPGYSRTDNTNAYLRSGEAVVVSEAMRNPWARNLVSAINVAHGGRDFSIPSSSRGYAVGGIFTDGGNANRYYNQPVNDAKDLANTLAYQMINNFPPVYVDVKDINNQQNILAQTINRVNL